MIIFTTLESGIDVGPGKFDKKNKRKKRETYNLKISVAHGKNCKIWHTWVIDKDIVPGKKS